MSNSLYFESALKALQSGKPLNDKDGVLTSLVKQLSEAALQAELEQHLESSEEPNCKNGSTTKAIKSSSGTFEFNTARDRSGSFESKL